MANKWMRSLISGFAGACAVTALNLGVQRVTDKAPKLEVLGMRALAQSMAGLGEEPPRGKRLYAQTLAGDLVSNTLYYSLVGSGDSKQGTWLRAVVLGLVAGVGSVLLPPLLGLGKQPTSNRTATRIMSILWYLFGALISAATARALHRST